MAKSREIVLLTSEFPPGPGGIGQHAWNLARELSRHGYYVKVITDGRLDWQAEEEVFDSAQPFELIRARRSRGRLMGIVHRLLLFLWAWCKANSTYPIIVSGKFPLWFAGFAKCLPLRRRVLAVLHGSEINYRSGWKRVLTSWALRRCERLVAVSRFTKSLAQRYVRGKEIVVIPNGFDPEKVQVSGNGKLDGRPALITVGSISPRKGQHNVVDALVDLQHAFPEIKYHIVGLPLHGKQLLRRIARLGLQNRVQVHGALPNSEMVKALKGSDVFLMLSENQSDGDVEGFGIAILEANACGVPAIGSRGCGIEDAIADGQSGKVVDPHNPNEIREALCEILDRYDRYSAGARQWAARFQWERVIAKYVDIIES